MRFAIALPGALLILWALAFASGPAQARDALYAAQRVPVDATAESAARARDQAVADGQRRALEIVLRRLTPKEAHGQLPQVDQALAATLVDGLRVENERTSARRYIAELTVEFRPRGVIDLLRGANVPFVEQPARPLLVLPIMEGEDGGMVMFDDPNPWRDAWREAAARKDVLAPVVVPLGDLRDVTTVSPEAALAGEDAALGELARRYGGTRWAVALARPAEGGGLNVSFTRATGAEIEAVGPEDGQEPAELMAAAVDRFMTRLEDEWKAEATALAARVVGGGAEGQLSARAPLGGLAEWLALRERLSRNAAVRQVDVLAISARDAQIVLRHFGTTEQLIEALARDDVELVGEGGYWRVALKGAQAAR